MDRLKDFVERHREEFDTHEPGHELWERMDEALNEKADRKVISVHRRPWKKMGMAASVAVLISFGMLWNKYRKPIENNRSVIELSPREGSALIRFAGSVDQKREEVERMSSENPELKQEFEEDIDMLGRQYEELKESLPNNPNQDEILEEMKKNLQWQMELLDQQKEIIDQEKRQKEGMVQNDPPVFAEEEMPVFVV